MGSNKSGLIVLDGGDNEKELKKIEETVFIDISDDENEQQMSKKDSENTQFHNSIKKWMDGGTADPPLASFLQRKGEEVNCAKKNLERARKKQDGAGKEIMEAEGASKNKRDDAGSSAV